MGEVGSRYQRERNLDFEERGSLNLKNIARPVDTHQATSHRLFGSDRFSETDRIGQDTYAHYDLRQCGDCRNRRIIRPSIASQTENRHGLGGSCNRSIRGFGVSGRAIL
jgi:hypothetical protein